MNLQWPKPANIQYSWFTDDCTFRFPPESFFIYSFFICNKFDFRSFGIFYFARKTFNSV